MSARHSFFLKFFRITQWDSDALNLALLVSDNQFDDFAFKAQITFHALFSFILNLKLFAVTVAAWLYVNASIIPCKIEFRFAENAGDDHHRILTLLRLNQATVFLAPSYQSVF